MNIQAHSLVIPKTAHYYTLGRPGPEVRYLWIVCHGYGQPAKRFLGKFDELAAPDTLIVAPEGLSRFYWGGFDGEVVASWMTREDRLDEIADYARYLQTLYDFFLNQLPAPNLRIVLLGFSQGCATQLRWIMQRFPRFHELILWAGSIPEDLDYRPHRDYFAGKSLHFVYGDEDPFLTPGRLDQQRQLIAEQQLAIKLHTFNGKHTIDRPALKRLEEIIRNQASAGIE